MWRSLGSGRENPQDNTSILISRFSVCTSMRDASLPETANLNCGQRLLNGANTGGRPDRGRHVLPGRRARRTIIQSYLFNPSPPRYPPSSSHTPLTKTARLLCSHKIIQLTEPLFNSNRKQQGGIKSSRVAPDTHANTNSLLSERLSSCRPIIASTICSFKEHRFLTTRTLM
jgi:hypothetical protein